MREESAADRMNDIMPVSGQDPVRILCVDDEPNILSALRRALRVDGYELRTCERGEEALSSLQAQSADVVISDMRMPEMDGAQLLARIAESWPDTVRILLTGYSDMDATVAVINEAGIYKYLSKPWNDADLRLTVRNAVERKQLTEERSRLKALTQRQNEELKVLNAGLEEQVRQRTAEIQQTLDMYELAYRQLKHAYTASVDVFANLIRLRQNDPSVEGCEKVADAARLVADKLGLPESEIQDIYYAAQLREIGKLGLPDGLLYKPLSSLPQQAKFKVTRHPIVGQGLLMGLDSMQDVGVIIRHQLEHYDGGGTPEGLIGAAIPLGSRILAILSDFFDLQSGKLIARRFSMSEARDYLLQNSGRRYDPDLVELCLNAVTELWGSIKETEVVLVMSNGIRPGMVLARDLIAPDGTRLLTRGTTITEPLIERIDHFERSMDQDLDMFVYEHQGV